MIESTISEASLCRSTVERLCCPEGRRAGVSNEEEELSNSTGEELLLGRALSLLFPNCGVFLLLPDLVGVDLIRAAESEAPADLRETVAESSDVFLVSGLSGNPSLILESLFKMSLCALLRGVSGGAVLSLVICSLSGERRSLLSLRAKAFRAVEAALIEIDDARGKGYSPERRGSVAGALSVSLFGLLVRGVTSLLELLSQSRLDSSRLLRDCSGTVGVFGVGREMGLLPDGWSRLSRWPKVPQARVAALLGTGTSDDFGGCRRSVAFGVLSLVPVRSVVRIVCRSGLDVLEGFLSRDGIEAVDGSGFRAGRGGGMLPCCGPRLLATACSEEDVLICEESRLKVFGRDKSV